LWMLRTLFIAANMLLMWIGIKMEEWEI